MFKNWLTHQGISPDAAHILGFSASLLLIVTIVFLSALVTRRLLIPIIERTVRHSSNLWDDILVAKHFFQRLSHLLPLLVAYLASLLIFPPPSLTGEFLKRLILALFVFSGVRVLDAFLNAVHAIYSSSELSTGKPIKGYLQALKIVAYVFAVILVIAVATDKSPFGVLTVFGGLTAVLILVFKDTLLGFVASIQLSNNDMVRIGDWIEMPKYGADGNVFDISINTIKVQNWDKTIATIPTYALVSDSFKNWRGMSESGGRRIKRSLYIDMNSVQFCTDEMLQRFTKIELIKKYLQEKSSEIDKYNRQHAVDPSALINGRRQTNLGVFRAYTVAYLRQHPKINQDMTFLVRHLQPTPQGLPIEIYVFSNDKIWANYEAIQADIFDHLLAAIPEFSLRVFQYPSGSDLGNVAKFWKTA